MYHPTILEKVIECFKSLPGIGEKSAERISLGIIDMNEDIVNELASSIIDCKKNLKPCSLCGNLTDQTLCNVCSDNTRKKDLICVLEDYKSVYNFEKSGNYKGVYHVLNGLISPIDHVNPSDINISSLIKRCEENTNCEIIIALKSTLEGEATTMYIKKILEDKNVIVSRLSYGLPIGAEIDYIDSITLERALEDRKKIS